ncbi:MAG: TrkA C-terminal domain-containing protein [Chloroflexi bacterium]|nr:TrkA C-terminal domain-containing protein [Chloroflexota bacterium]
MSLARLTISEDAPFSARTIGFVEDNYHLNVVLHRRNSHSEMHPTDNTQLHPGDVIAILGGPEQLNQILHDNGQ